MNDESNPYADFGKESNPFASPAVTQTALDVTQNSSLTPKQILFSATGRIPRRTYWGATIGVAFCFYAIVIAASLVFFALFDEQETGEVAAGLTMLALYPVVLWITVCVQAKRWHDRGKSGWMFCINFIPLIGPIWTFVECGCLRGDPGPNQYGNDPT